MSERDTKPDVPFLGYMFRYKREPCLIISEPQWRTRGERYMDGVPSNSYGRRGLGTHLINQDGWYVRMIAGNGRYPKLRYWNVEWLRTAEQIYAQMFNEARNGGQVVFDATETAKREVARHARATADFRLKWGLP